ncbi:LacI family DNA-binding transcriptional regulator [Martelella mediterranea]|uniref:LacI family transcriptional regulator n=1 Tax=Martelella mediterranea TaxID=293089 RepID=A0A4R3NJ07_9HYPH|nr:LacI family DNA-binding transcriptional regulator [Martelella mediterranea]TCT33059.1 LacI family transcriptional regulator [Martelella mediterranea]
MVDEIKDKFSGPRSTLADVATLAGVSKSTVSLFMNGKLNRMGTKTQKRIEEALQQLGYTIDPLARSLSTGRTRTIALAWDASNYDYYFEDLYFMYFAKMVARAVKERDYTLMLLDPADLWQNQRLIDGVIVKATEAARTDLRRVEANMAVVSIGKFSEQTAIPSVSVDDVQSGRLGFERLARKCRSIKVLSFPPKQVIGFDERVEGARGKAAEMGIAFSVEYGRMDEKLGRTVVARDHAAGTLPDAYFCLNDVVALGILSESRTLGISVPGEVSILGVDDTPTVSHCLGLTTLKHPIENLAAAAVDLLISRIEQPQIAVEDVVLPVELVERQTV